MPGCAVVNCHNNTRKSETRGVTFHSFPRGVIRKLWVGMCGRADSFDPETSKICSDHFLESDFECDLNSENSCSTPKKVLREGAVPLINTPVQPELNDEVEVIKYTHKRKMEAATDEIGKGSKEPKDDAAKAIAVVLQEKIKRNLEPLDENCINYNLSLLVNCACFIGDINEKTENGEMNSQNETLSKELKIFGQIVSQI